MAALAINLTEFSDLGNKREYVEDGHALLLPKRVTFTRSPADGNKTVQEYRFVVSHGAMDVVTSEFLPERITCEVKLRAPIKTSTASIDAVMTVANALIISDEYANGSHDLRWPV